MKNNTVKCLLLNAVVTMGFTMAGSAAYAANNAPLTVSVAASSGTLYGTVAPGSKTNATVLVSITDSGGNPIDNLQLLSVQVNTFMVPSGATCGFGATALIKNSQPTM